MNLVSDDPTEIIPPATKTRDMYYKRDLSVPKKSTADPYMGGRKLRKDFLVPATHPTPVPPATAFTADIWQLTQMQESESHKKLHSNYADKQMTVFQNKHGYGAWKKK
mmetsp:Transcript_22097/g.29527  ORF Transcript_22097/g.29527 Transcript_22097/m.29527 type:complete len:108 (+) Transcript_22097:1990-2313(+)